MVVYTYLDPGKKGENICYWRSTNPDVFSEYTVENTAEESLTKKRRARSLRPQDEFFVVMCRLRHGFQLFNDSTSTVGRIFITSDLDY